jgi:hypothetical protein
LPARAVVFNPSHATMGSATGQPGRAQRACEAEPGHKQSSGLFVPGEGPGLCARRGLQGPSSTGVEARACTHALRELTRRDCPTTVSAANGGSFATGPRDRAAQGSRSEAKAAEVARWARPGCRVAALPQAAWKFNVCNGPRADAGFMHRGSREAQWSH